MNFRAQTRASCQGWNHVGGGDSFEKPPSEGGKFSRIRKRDRASILRVNRAPRIKEVGRVFRGVPARASSDKAVSYFPYRLSRPVIYSISLRIIQKPAPAIADVSFFAPPRNSLRSSLVNIVRVCVCESACEHRGAEYRTGDSSEVISILRGSHFLFLLFEGKGKYANNNSTYTRAPEGSFIFV